AIIGQAGNCVSCLLARGSFGAGPFLQDHHLDPPVLLSSARRVVVDDRELGAIAFGADPLSGYSLFDEPVPNGVSPLLRQLDVEVLVARVVRVPLDQYVAPWIGLEEVRELVDAALPARAHLGLADSEEHVTDRQHEAATGLLCL